MYREADNGLTHLIGGFSHIGVKRRQGGDVCASSRLVVRGDMMDDGGDGCDPKGVGVLTTSTRYSRKRHIHTPSILHRAHSASIPLSFLLCTPGVLGTLLSNILYKIVSL